jgi:outer membrane protein TolC
VSSRSPFRSVLPRRSWALSGFALAAWCVAARAEAQTPASPAGATPSTVAATPAPASDVSPGMARFTEVLGQSGGITARDAGRRASTTSVQAAVKHEQVAKAESDRSHVIWDSVPRLTLSGQATRLSKVEPFNLDLPPALTGGTPLPSFPVLQNNFTLRAQLSVPLTEYLLRLVLALRGAGANIAASEIEERVARLSSSANAKLGYYEWVRARLARVLSVQLLEQAQRQLEHTRALNAAGRTADADLLQAQAFEANAELARTRADTEEALAEERLRVALHAPSAEELRVGEDVLGAFAGAEEPHDLEALYREALAQRLELQSLDKSRDASEQLRAIEASRALPRLEAVGNLIYANPNQRIFPQQDRWDSSWDVGLSLTWSVSDLGTSAASAEAARSQRDQLVHQRTLAEESLRLEVASAFRGLGQARQNVNTAEQGERAALAAYQARARLSEQGMATELELIQALTAAVQARLGLIDAHIALRVARVQLDHALGRDLAEL